MKIRRCGKNIPHHACKMQPAAELAFAPMKAEQSKAGGFNQFRSRITSAFFRFSGLPAQGSFPSVTQTAQSLLPWVRLPPGYFASFSVIMTLIVPVGSTFSRNMPKVLAIAVKRPACRRGQKNPTPHRNDLIGHCRLEPTKPLESGHFLAFLAGERWDGEPH